MTSFAASSLRLLRRLFAAPPTEQEGPLYAGAPTVLDGLSAVAITEAMMSESAALGSGFPASAAARVWRRRRLFEGANRFLTPLTSTESDHARGTLSSAIGMAQAGRRATCFLDGPSITPCADLISHAVAQHAPLVIHLSCRAGVGHGQALGSGHACAHAAADAGAITLFATSVQDAVDLTLLARRLAERALLPVVVAMDVEHTALAAQNVRLPDDELLRSFVCDPSTRIEAPTPAQRMLFGAQRRLTPRMYDLDRPMMLGAHLPAHAYAAGAAGHQPFFFDHVPALLSEALEQFRTLTGRTPSSIIEHNAVDAEAILIAQGGMVETLIAAVKAQDADAKIGVLGIRQLKPFPVDAVTARIKHAKIAAVLERNDAPHADAGPLAREIRAALGSIARNTPVVNVMYGVGGLPLNAKDLAELIRVLPGAKHTRMVLGLDTTGSSAHLPKRQALQDQLKRHYPELAPLGVCGAKPAKDPRPDGAKTVAIHRMAGGAFEPLAGEAAGVTHALFGGSLRSRPGMTWQRFDEPCVDMVTHAEADLLDPGDDAPVDIAVVAADRLHRLMDPTQRLAGGGDLLLLTNRDADEFAESIPQPLREALSARRVQLHAILAPWSDDDAPTPDVVREHYLGGLTALLLKRKDVNDNASTKAREARETMLADVEASARGRLLDAFMTGFASIRPIDLAGAPACEIEDEETIEAPHVVRSLGRTDQTVDALARFWDQVGVLYRTGRGDELSVDPYLTTGAVPPLTATFRDVGDAAGALLEFVPETCDGDGRLWTTCPDGSVAAAVVSSRQLIDLGIEMAGEAGVPADALRSIAAKLARKVNSAIASLDEPPMIARALFTLAFDALMKESDRRSSLQAPFDALIEQIGDLPMGPTEAFFAEPEREAAGTGEFLILGVNPDACKCPHLVIAECEGKGLRAVERTPEALDRARRLWALWQRLPDTSGKTIERVRTHEAIGPLAAALLSRTCQFAMTAGDGAEAGSGAKLAVRHAMALAEFHLQPRVQEALGTIEGLRDRLAGRIREHLADAMPANDLDALSEGLAALGRDDVQIADLAQTMDTASSSGAVDAAALGRLVDVSKGLAELNWRMSEGPNKLGRARVGLALASGSTSHWAAAFPYNAFQCPAAVDPGGETMQFALGLMEGQMAQTLAGVRLMRWARAELENPNEATKELDALRALRFRDLTNEERQLCPPMLVVGDDHALASRELSQLARLLDTDLPVKVIVLSEAGGRADAGMSVDALAGYPTGGRIDTTLLGVIGRRAYVAQTSPAAGPHFAETVLEAMNFDGPALVCVHCPSPERHGFDAARTLADARRAIQSRAFPLLRFDPRLEGVFGSCLDLAGNPEPDAVFAHGDDGRILTPLDWAHGEARFNVHFTPVDAAAHATVSAAEYLQKPTADQADCTPVVDIEDENGRRQLAVGDDLAQDAARRVQYWRTLQELAGVVTPFTARVRGEAEQLLSAMHQQELDDLKRSYEQQIAELQQRFEQDAVDRVTSRLVAMAGYGAEDEEREG